MTAIFLALMLTGAGGLVEVQGNANPPAPPTMPSWADPPPPQRQRANLNTYFSTDDYPAVSLVYHHEGTTAFALTVGVDGRVTDCRIIRSSGAVPLDEATCRILRSRARYNPARAADGTPVEGSDSGRVTWRLPEDWGRAGLPMAWHGAHLLNRNAAQMTTADLPETTPRPPTGAAAGLRVAVGQDGRVIGCDISRSSGSPAFDAAACRHYADRARFEPARDPAGALMCDVVWLSIAWPAPTPNSRPAHGADPADPPLPLRQQIRAYQCPGWPANGALR
jgi:TonB family protein